MLVNLKELKREYRKEAIENIAENKSDIWRLIDLYKESKTLDTLHQVVYQKAYLKYPLRALKIFRNLEVYSRYDNILYFLKESILDNKISYTTTSHNLLLQDILNLIYTNKPFEISKYDYLLTDESRLTHLVKTSLNKEVILELPKNIKITDGGCPTKFELHKLIKHANTFENAYKILHHLYYIPFYVSDIR